MSNYINITADRLKPYIEVKEFDEVIVKNLNGNYYRYVIRSREGWHSVNTPNGLRRCWGIQLSINKNSGTAVYQKNDMFIISDIGGVLI